MGFSRLFSMGFFLDDFFNGFFFYDSVLDSFRRNFFSKGFFLFDFFYRVFLVNFSMGFSLYCFFRDTFSKEIIFR